MTDLQKLVQAVLDQLVAAGQERGVQFAAYLDGTLVVNACAGVMGEHDPRPITTETLFPVFSCTKGVAATVIHLMAERGVLSYDQPIAEVWPEFGAHGKGGITLRHALTHSAGLPFMPYPLTYEQASDWDWMCARIAEMTPNAPAGDHHEYHAITYGYLLGEVVQRVDGRSFNQYLQEEICAPLGTTRLHVGIPEGIDDQIVELGEKVRSEPLADNGQPQAIPYFMQPLTDMLNRADMRRTCMPASNGIMTAEALARHYASILPGGVDGVEILPPSRVALAAAPQTQLNPEKPEAFLHAALGYGLGHADSDYGPTNAAFGHGGAGGSIGFADRSLGLAVGFARNMFSADDQRKLILKTLRDGITAMRGVEGNLDRSSAIA